MTRVKGQIVAAVIALAALATTASGADRLDFVDEFTIGRVFLRTEFYASNFNFWNGQTSSPYGNRRWSPAGSQPVGWADHVLMQSQFDVDDDSNIECINATVNLARWRYTTIPQDGASCTSGSGGIYHGSVSFTKNSCAYPVGDHYFSHHNLPEWNFASESTATPYSYRGYRVRQRLTCNCSPVQTIDDEGCFRIYWTP